jgi:subtilisin-like proprotein convertase family protein
MPKPGGKPGGGGGVAFDILGLTSASDSGISSSDDLTNFDTGFTISGTIDPSITSFTISINGAGYQVTGIDAAGNWSFTYRGPSLADGTVLVEAYYTTVHPKSGKTQTTAAEPYSFTLDSTIATPTIGSATAGAGGVLLGGTAEAGASVSILRDAVEIGTVTAAADGSWSFTDTAGGGSATYSVSATDAAGNTAQSADFSYVPDPANGAPVATDDSAAISEDTPVAIPVLANDSDPDGDTVAIESVGPAANGAVALNPDGTITYTPTANWSGTDSFSYTVSDGRGGTDTATVTVTVSAVNDAPVAADDSAATNEDTAVVVAVLANDSDVEGDSLGLTIESQGAHGTATVNPDGTITYTPAANWSGTDSFSYRVSDGQGGSTVASVTVTVNPVNDTPVAGDDSAATDQATAVVIAVLANDSDIDGDALTVTGAGNGAHGTTAVNADGTITYTPNAGFAGEDSFTYTISDGQGGTETATVTVAVNPAPPPPPPPPGGDSYTPDDPLYSQQWHLAMLGDIEAVWADFTGAGVSVGVYDNGIEYVHPDLWDNYDDSKHVWVNGSQLDPAPSGTVTAEHGTAVAGVIAAVDNGEGGVGVAFGAALTGINIFGGPADINGTNISSYQQAIDQAWTFDIINNSWGSAPDFNNESAPSTLASLSGFQTAVETGRGGLGTIVVKAAGNEYDNANGDALNASRYTITVAAHDQDGDASWYTNRGPNVLVSAPSSGSSADADGGILTTDEQGAQGYDPGDYTPDFGGTSSATPVVSGVVALMLDANPDLGWRDVQTILAYSAHFLGGNPGGTAPVPADSNGDGVADTTVQFPIEFFDWFYNGGANWNGGGLHFSEDYGYGGVDAYNAVRMAEVWSLFGAPETSADEVIVQGAMQTPGLVYDNAWVGASYSYSQAMADANPMELEYVEVHVDFNSGRGSLFGDLSDVSIELVSPSGTVVSLIQSANAMSGADAWQSTNSWLPALGGTVTWTFGVTALRGEDLVGDWTVRIIDVDDDPFGNDGGVLNAFRLTFYGAAADADDVYHYTAEILDLGLYADSGRRVLDDSGGNDWLDMAAMPQDLQVDLAPDGSGGASVAGGATFLEIADGTRIENAVTGDGNDALAGNDAPNQLAGRRGSDQLWGGLGDDTFIFYAGDGDDWIWDFEDSFAGGDIIALYGFGFDSTADFLVTDDDMDTVLDFGNGDSITLAGFADSSLIGDDDFVFV